MQKDRLEKTKVNSDVQKAEMILSPSQFIGDNPSNNRTLEEKITNGLNPSAVVFTIPITTENSSIKGNPSGLRNSCPAAFSLKNSNSNNSLKNSNTSNSDSFNSELSEDELADRIQKDRIRMLKSFNKLTKSLHDILKELYRLYGHEFNTLFECRTKCIESSPGSREYELNQKEMFKLYSDLKEQINPKFFIFNKNFNWISLIIDEWEEELETFLNPEKYGENAEISVYAHSRNHEDDVVIDLFETIYKNY